MKEWASKSPARWRALHLTLLAVSAVMAALLGLWCGNTEIGLDIDRRSRGSEFSMRTLPLHPAIRSISYDLAKTDRGDFAKLVNALDDAGAAVLFLNIRLARTDGPGTKELEDALLNLKHTVVVVGLSKDPTKNDQVPRANGYYFRTGLINRDKDGNAILADGRRLANVRVGSGVVDNPDGKVSSFQLMVKDLSGKAPIASAMLLATLEYLSPNHAQLRATEDRTELWVTDRSWRSLPDFRIVLQPLIEGELQTTNLSDVLASKNLDTFRGKLVLLGPIEPKAPTAVGRMSGSEIIVAATNTLLLFEGKARENRQISPLYSLLVAAIAAFSSLGRLPTTRSRTSGLWGAVLTICGFTLAGILAWSLPGFLLDHYGFLPTPSRLYFSAGFGALFGLLLVSRFSEGFQPLGLPDRFDGPGTALFVDLRSSTPLVDKIGAAEASRVLGRFLDGVAAAIQAHQGKVERTLGDGVLAIFFGPPVGGADHSLRAAAAVTEIGMITEPLAAEVKERWGLETGFTAGLESGQLTVSHMRTDKGWEWQSFGPTVHLAKRLQEACSRMGRSALLGPECESAVRASLKTHPEGEIEAKGFDRPVKIFTLD